MPFLRQLYKQKPKQWGPLSNVQSAVFYNLEDYYHIDYKTCQLALSSWSPSAVDYSKNNFTTTISGAKFQKNYFYFDGDADYISIPQSVISQAEFSIFFEEYSIGTSNTGYFLGDSNDAVNLFLRRRAAVPSDYSYGIGDQIIDIGGSIPRQTWNQNLVTHDALGNATWSINGDSSLGALSGSNFTGLTSALYLGNRQDLTRDFLGNLKNVLIFSQTLNETQQDKLFENSNQLFQPVLQKTLFLPLSTQLPINSILQSQSIDNLDFIQHNVLSIDPINQDQSMDNIDLIISISLIIDKMIQNQSLENIPLLQHNILAIDSLEQIQEMDNLDLIIAGVLSIAPIIQSQSIETIIIIQHNNLAIDGIDQAQESEQITLDTGILLQIAGMIQNQSIDSLDLTQAHILEIDELLQGQAIDKIILSIIGERIVITLTLKSPGIDLSLSSPGIDLEIE